MEWSPRQLNDYLRERLPEGQSAESLAEDCPWYPLAHWLLAAKEREEESLLQKAALYAPDPIRLHAWLTRWREQAIEEAKGVEALAAISPEIAAPELDQETLAETLETSAKPPEDPEPEPGPAHEQPEEQDLVIPAETTDSAGGIHLPGLEAVREILDKPAAEDAELPGPEPYHAVDYFASQGIRASQATDAEATPLDKQVKSFTEWLKSMKKLAYQPATTYTDPLVDARAKASLANKEVITEAMAEVLVKQGSVDKAVETYRKLQELHPEKSLFFAARIEALKHSK